ncbi:hypothetical protein [Nonlabens xiamenensis]|uniref:hypothetical protein n=1 Tax=Nonlabens xiamenensis TaxID=2341043 RepID=UPI000F6120B5|nr:hypothetical protein [Nonlabens xiamenensis]
MNTIAPTLDQILPLEKIPNELSALRDALTNVFDGLFVHDVIIGHSTYSDAGFYSFTIKSYTGVQLDIPFVTDLKLVLNPDPSGISGMSVPIEFDYSWLILRYISEFNITSFDNSIKSVFEIIFKLAGVTPDELLYTAVNKLASNNLNDLNDLINAFNSTFNENVQIINEPHLNEFDQYSEFTKSIANLSYDPIEVIYELFLSSSNVTLEDVQLIFEDFIDNIVDSLMEAIQLHFNLIIRNIAIGLQFPHKWLRPVNTSAINEPGIGIDEPLPDQYFSFLTFDVGTFRYSTRRGFEFEQTTAFSLSRSVIGKTGIIAEFLGLKVDLSKGRNIPEAVLDGRPDNFRGVFASQASLTLPKKWFNSTDNTTLQLVGRNLLIGTGGVSGTIGLEAVTPGANIANSVLSTKIGNWELGFSSFDMVFSQNVVVSSNITGSLKIPKLKDANDNPAELLISAHLQENGDFQLTASEPDGIEARLADLVIFNFKSVELGTQNDDFYIGTQVDISFPQDSVIHKLTKGQVIKLPRLRVYDNGSMEIVGGNSFIPTNLSLPLGPIDIDVTGIHLGSHQQQHDGIERTYNYIGFDGAISLNPVGIDARGEGVKYYYTTDNDEPALDANGDPILDAQGNPVIKQAHGFLRIQTIEVEMVIPNDAEAESAKAVITGMLSIPEPGVSQEFIGKVTFEQNNPTGLSAGADMRFMPREPAFVIEAGLELPKPIPLLGTGLGFYGFGGLLGYNYVAEKEAIGLVSGEDTWYDYYTYPRRGVNIDKFSEPPKTDEYNFPFSIGAGTVLGTDGDDGYLFSSRLMLILSLPSVLILDGRANLLGDRIKMMDRTEPPFFAGVAIGDASVEFWAGADFSLEKSGTFKGKLISLYAEAQAAFFKNNPSAWYINIGTRDNPVTARVLDLVTARSFIMISASGLEAGARVDFELRKRFGPARVELTAYLEVGGMISFERPQIGGYIALGGKARVDIWVVSIEISVDAILSVEATKPFLLYAELRLRACIRIAFARICKRFTVKLKWEKNNQVDRTPIAPLTFEDSLPYKLDKSNDLVKGVHMLTSETFNLTKLHIVESGTAVNINAFENSIANVIPIDTYIDLKSAKSLDPTAVNLSSTSEAKIGGNTHGADNFVDLIPPNKVVRGGRELRQVKHKYSIEEIEIKALDRSGNWQHYHPFEAVVKETDRAQFANSPVGYWQKSDKKYNTIRIPSTNPFQYTENGSPGSFIPEHYGITPSDLFCEGELRDYTYSDFVDETLGRIYFNPSQFEAHYIDQAYYALNFNNFLVVGTSPDGSQNILENADYLQITDEPNPFNKVHSLKFDNYSELVVKIPQAAKKVKLSIQTYSTGVTLQFFKSDGFTNDEVVHTQFDSVYLNRNQLNVAYEYEAQNDLISKVIIMPNRADQAALQNAQNQLNNYISNYYNGQNGPLSDITSDSQYLNLLSNLNDLKDIACDSDIITLPCEENTELCSLYKELISIFQIDFIFPVAKPEYLLGEIQTVFEEFHSILVSFIDENPELNLKDQLSPTYDTYIIFQNIVTSWSNSEEVNISTYYMFRNVTYRLLQDIYVLANCDCKDRQVEIKKCYTTVQEVGWLSIADFEYNSTVPEIAAINEERTQMIETLQSVAMPVWRPDTKYYIRFRLKDEVDNDSALAKSWDYYYGFKTVGPLGFYQDHPDVDYIGTDRNEDSYALTTLKSYIDYQKSYPQANGNLLQAKPLFYGNEQAQIELFFIKPFVQHMLNNWNGYKISGSQGFDALNGSISLAIKDPVSDEIIPYPLPVNFSSETVPNTLDEWVDDRDPRIPSTIMFLNNIIDRINQDNSTISCQLDMGNPISPVHQNFKAILSNLKPQKLYTVLVYNNYAGTSTAYERKKIHEFVFQTSRYASFSDQVNSYKLSAVEEDTETLMEKDLVLDMSMDLSVNKIQIIKNLILDTPNSSAEELEKDVVNRFDRIVDTILELGTLDPPVCSEFNVIRNSNDDKVIAILFRNPEPLNSPLIPSDIIYSGLTASSLMPSVQILKEDMTPDSGFSILHSKDRSQFIICHNSMNIDRPKLNLKLSYIKWNGSDYEENDTVTIEDLIIN